MDLIKDYKHPIEALWDESGQCRIRVYTGEGLSTVIICSEIPENQSGSIVTIAEWIAKEVWEKEKKPEPFIWIEHYPSGLSPQGSEIFQQVTFVQIPNSSKFFSPQWKKMTRANVEELIGQQVE